MQFTPLGPWGAGASAGPATEGLKGDSGRVADPNPLREGKGLITVGARVSWSISWRCRVRVASV